MRAVPRYLVKVRCHVRVSGLAFQLYLRYLRARVSGLGFRVYMCSLVRVSEVGCRV